MVGGAGCFCLDTCQAQAHAADEVPRDTVDGGMEDLSEAGNERQDPRQPEAPEATQNGATGHSDTVVTVDGGTEDLHEACREQNDTRQPEEPEAPQNGATGHPDEETCGPALDPM